MPGFTTHYLFGVDACRRLTSTSMHNMIRRDHSAYALGLQGPDLFFYSLPSYLMHRKNIGDLAHRKDTGQFFANLLQSRKLFAGNQSAADARIGPDVDDKFFQPDHKALEKKPWKISLSMDESRRGGADSTDLL